VEEVTIVPRSSIKNEKMYQDLRRQGDSKEKAARISNAAAARGKSAVARKGGKSGSYTDWTVPQLKRRAKELGMSGYSGLTKDKLVAKLRNH
jgi:hypothetical protein